MTLNGRLNYQSVEFTEGKDKTKQEQWWQWREQNWLGEWKEMELVCYFERAETAGIMLTSP